MPLNYRSITISAMATYFPDITGYGDIDHERFEDYMVVGYHYIDPGSLAEYLRHSFTYVPGSSRSTF